MLCVVGADNRVIDGGAGDGQPGDEIPVLTETGGKVNFCRRLGRFSRQSSCHRRLLLRHGMCGKRE